MYSNRYIIVFTFVMTAVVALVLALLFSGLKGVHDFNEAIYNKKEILLSINPKADKFTSAEIDKIFRDSVEQLVLDANGEIIPDTSLLAEKIDMAKEKKKPEAERRYPLYIYTQKDGSKVYITSMRGNGLWDEIWGAIAIEQDFRTVAGVSFGHKGETPGLGAEIKDNKGWVAKFATGEKKIISDDGSAYLQVRKGGARDEIMEVDGISGATVTCDGVTKMIKSGIQPYLTYFSTLENKQTGMR
ncbi:MAG: FMN-binding protein [Bacteroidota bacterium]